jgi:shikimate kinase
MNIFLIGFMGSGKTTLGKMLSKRKDMVFVDLDAEIENLKCMTVGKLNVILGEPAFREIERNILLEVIKTDNQIISVGGGTPCFFDNMELMNRAGITIYLKMDKESIHQRLLHLPPASLAKRLSIANKSKTQIMQFVTANLDKREKFYSQARIIVENDVHDKVITLNRIALALDDQKMK